MGAFCVRCPSIKLWRNAGYFTETRNPNASKGIGVLTLRKLLLVTVASLRWEGHRRLHHKHIRKQVRCQYPVFKAETGLIPDEPEVRRDVIAWSAHHGPKVDHSDPVGITANEIRPASSDVPAGRLRAARATNRRREARTRERSGGRPPGRAQAPAGTRRSPHG